MDKLKKILKVIIDIIEIYIPVAMLIILFMAFIIGIFFRYVLKNPQSWTYEASSIAFLSFTILSACYVGRVDKHIEFDMIFNRMSDKAQSIMNMVSNLLIAIVCAMLVPAAIKFIGSMKGLYTQVLDIPRGMVYWCMVVLFTLTCIRTAIRFGRGIHKFSKGDYSRHYGEGSE